MQMSDLKYEAVQVAESIQELTEKTVSEAKELLGYEQGDAPSAIQQAPPLATALNRLGIEVLNKKQVRAYATEKAIENSRLAIEETFNVDSKYRLDCYLGYVIRMQEIKEYKQPIPEHILSRAIEIKRELTESKFHVMSIERDPDPFLIVELNDFREFFFIGVWAEPRFESKN